MNKSVMIAVAFVLCVGGYGALKIAATSFNQTHEQMVNEQLSPEQRAEAYTEVKAELDTAVTRVTTTIGSKEMKDQLTSLDADLTALNAIKGEYDSAKAGNAKADALRAIAARYAEKVRSVEKTVGYAAGAISEDRSTIMQNTMVLAMLDAERWNKDKGAVLKALESADPVMKSISKAVKLAGPVIGPAHKELAPRRAAGAEVTPAEETEAYVNASVKFLDTPPQPAEGSAAPSGDGGSAPASKWATPAPAADPQDKN